MGGNWPPVSGWLRLQILARSDGLAYTNRQHSHLVGEKGAHAHRDFARSGQPISE